MIKTNLKNLMESKKISINKLSEKTGLSRKTLTSIYNNETDNNKGVQYGTISTLCEFFDINIGDLLEFTPDNPEFNCEISASIDRIFFMKETDTKFLNFTPTHLLQYSVSVGTVKRFTNLLISKSFIKEFPSKVDIVVECLDNNNTKVLLQMMNHAFASSSDSIESFLTEELEARYFIKSIQNNRNFAKLLILDLFLNIFDKKELKNIEFVQVSFLVDINYNESNKEYVSYTFEVKAEKESIKLIPMNILKPIYI